MATLKYLDTTYECTTAIRGDNYIHLLDANGNVTAAFDGIKDFSGFTLTGCSWTLPSPCDKCSIAVINVDGSIEKGDAKYDDLILADSSYIIPAYKDFLSAYKELIAKRYDEPAPDATLKPVGIRGDKTVTGLPSEIAGAEWEGIVLYTGLSPQRVLVWRCDSEVMYSCYLNYSSQTIKWSKVSLNPAGDTMTGPLDMAADGDTARMRLRATSEWGYVEVFSTSSSGNKRLLAIGRAASEDSCIQLEVWNGNVMTKAYKLYHEGNKPTAADIGSGTFSTTDIFAMPGSDYSVARLRNISFGTAELTDRVSTLADGEIYFMYE